MSLVFNAIVRVIDQDGTTRGEIKALVDKTNIITEDASLPIDVGDTIERDLPHGRKETHLVTEVEFHKSLGRIPDFYEVTTRNPDSLSDQPGERGVSVYVADSPHTRVNLNSIDNSNNVVNTQAHEVFQQIRHLLETGVEDSGERTALLQSVDEMQTAHETQDNFISKYKDFMGLAANHMTVLTPVIPALTSLL